MSQTEGRGRDHNWWTMLLLSALGALLGGLLSLVVACSLGSLCLPLSEDFGAGFGELTSAGFIYLAGLWIGGNLGLLLVGQLRTRGAVIGGLSGLAGLGIVSLLILLKVWLKGTLLKGTHELLPDWVENLILGLIPWVSLNIGLSWSLRRKNK